MAIFKGVATGKDSPRKVGRKSRKADKSKRVKLNVRRKAPPKTRGR